MRTLIVHGPPRSGKDTFVNNVADLVRDHHRTLHRQVGQSLKEATHAFYQSLAGRRMDLVPGWDHFETCKETPQAFFLGLTPRDAYIQAHERLIKPLHGKTTLVNATVHAIYGQGRGHTLIVVSGLTGPEDVQVIADEIATPVVVNIEREGCEWDNRKPLPDGLTYQNDGTIDDMREWIRLELLPRLGVRIL